MGGPSDALTELFDSLELLVLALLDQNPDGRDTRDAGCDQMDVASELSELRWAGLIKTSVVLDLVQLRIIFPLGKVHWTGSGTP